MAGLWTPFKRLINGRLWSGGEGTGRGEIRKGISEFYDEVTDSWESLWGEHIHHGFYEAGALSLTPDDHRAAQLRIIEEALAFGAISDEEEKKPKKIIDIGCGIGGTSRYLAKKYGSEITCITLSPVQAKRAEELAAAKGLSDKISVQVADALEQPFPDGQFDMVWSLESGEYMPDKEKFVSEIARVAAPGATIIIVTWCHRDLSDSEEALKPEEVTLLNKICNAYYMPAMCSPAEYVRIAKSLSLQDIRMADWSENVAPFWDGAITTASTWRGATALILSGWKTVRGALGMPLMVECYKRKLVKYIAFTCRKPE